VELGAAGQTGDTYRSEERTGLIELPTETVGFHGTQRAAVSQLLARNIEPSNNGYDWLGTGFYLWQDSPWRAAEWAREQHGDEAAVVAVLLSLEGCLDLLEPAWQGRLREADAQFVAESLAEGRALPANRGGNRARDRATINWFCDEAGQQGLSIRSVRAIFEEGDPIFEASAIRSRSHIQIAVRDPRAILEIEEVTL
jgi:hypothetical protein